MTYLLILIGKIIEVTMMTLRVMLITRGEKRVGAIVAFFEVMLWVVIVANVLDGLMDDPLKIFVYALGFAIGNYTGSLVEGYLGLGTSQVQIIAKEKNSDKIRAELYEEGYACTAVKGEGKNFARQILYVIAPRKKVEEVIKVATDIQSDAVVSVQDTKPYHGGYGIRK